MRKSNPSHVYDLSYSVHPFVSIQGDQEPFSLFQQFHQAITVLTACVNGDTSITLGIAKNSALNLLAKISDTQQRIFFDEERKFRDPFPTKVHSWQIPGIQDAARNFEAVFKAELENQAIFQISPVSIYDTEAMVERASCSLAPEILKLTPPTVRFEIDQAGKCLAFGLYTATGFHVCRAIELAMHEYYRFYSGGSERLKTWGAYLSNLHRLSNEADEEKSPHKSTVVLLEQIKDASRNPIIHPRVNVTQTDALYLFDIGKATISRMVYDLAEKHYSMADGYMNDSFVDHEDDFARSL
ncbi:hypothetical protein [Geminicoccus roseus]|uniref:hypothetical protein n=1 Tax=Geminicoccus roseus TaxID=404900 RepID=UPI0012FB42BE|nr:hypothetical protein [Geminicoccus roseus]